MLFHKIKIIYKTIIFNETKQVFTWPNADAKLKVIMFNSTNG